MESKIYSAITGHEVSMQELDSLAEGVEHLKRALTVRDGQTRDMRGAKGCRMGQFRGHDNLAALYFNKPADFSWSGVNYSFPPLDRQKYEEAKTLLYRQMGWDYNGAPTGETLKKFNMKKVATELGMKDLLGEKDS